MSGPNTTGRTTRGRTHDPRPDEQPVAGRTTRGRTHNPWPDERPVGRDHCPLALFVVLSASAALLGGACRGDDSAAGAPQQRGPSAVPVEAAPVRTDTLRETVRGIGTLRAVQSVVLRPEQAGIVEEVHFADGARVAQGDLLFTLDDETLQRREAAQEAALKAARARQRNAERTLRRRTELRRERVISEASFEDVQTEARLAAAEVDRLRAELALVERQMEETRIEAPFAGRLGESQVDPGAYVSVGQELATLYRTDRLDVAFRVPARVVGRVREGQPVAVRVDAYPDRVFDGTVEFVSPAVREESRDLLLKASLDNAEGLLKPGSFATAEVTVDTREQVPVVPEEALVATRAGYLAYVIEEGTARRREVTVGLRVPGLAEVREGLAPGETVVKSGHMRLSDGSPVVVRAVGTTPLPGAPPDAGPSPSAVLDAVEAPVADGGLLDVAESVDGAAGGAPSDAPGETETPDGLEAQGENGAPAGAAPGEAAAR